MLTVKTVECEGLHKSVHDELVLTHCCEILDRQLAYLYVVINPHSFVLKLVEHERFPGVA